MLEAAASCAISLRPRCPTFYRKFGRLLEEAQRQQMLKKMSPHSWPDMTRSLRAFKNHPNNGLADPQRREKSSLALCLLWKDSRMAAKQILIFMRKQSYHSWTEGPKWAEKWRRKWFSPPWTTTSWATMTPSAVQHPFYKKSLARQWRLIKARSIKAL